MISNNWDIYILNPLLIVLVAGIFLAMHLKNYQTAKHWIFFGQCFLLWLGLSVNLQNALDLQSSLYFMRNKYLTNSAIAFFLMAGLFATMFMIPVQWVTNLLHHRKFFLIGSTALGGLVSLIQIFVFSASLEIIAIVIFGIITAMGCLMYISFNETFQQQFTPLRTVAVISPLILIATLCGSSFNLIARQGATSTLTNQQQQIISSISCIVFLLSAGISFINTEYTKQVGHFNLNKITLFETFKPIKFILLLLILCMIVICKSLINNDLWGLWLGQTAYQQNYNTAQIAQLLRMQKQWLLVFQILGGLTGSTILIRKFGPYAAVYSMLVLWAIVMVFGIFNNSVWGFFVVAIITGYTYGVLLNCLLGLMLMWNARSDSKIMMGGVFAVVMGIQFLVEYFVTLSNLQQWGLFGEKQPLAFYANSKSLLGSIQQVDIYLGTSVIVLILIVSVVWFWKSALIMAEYRDPSVLLSKKLNQLLGEDIHSSLQQANASLDKKNDVK